MARKKPQPFDEIFKSGLQIFIQKKKLFLKMFLSFQKVFFAVYDLNGNCKKKSYWKINFEKKINILLKKTQIM